MCAKVSEAICVLHALQKKSQKTDKNDIELARKRLKEIGGDV
jgi:phage-related protein